ncbi:MAG: hypothetical protein ACKV2T_28965 [Kofleriaceae bacterium]
MTTNQETTMDYRYGSSFGSDFSFDPDDFSSKGPGPMDDVSLRSTPFDPVSAFKSNFTFQGDSIGKFGPKGSTITKVAKKAPIVSGLIDGINTSIKNPNNLNTMGRVLHGGMVGLGSSLTPTPVTMLDTMTGNHLNNMMTDSTGAFLQQFSSLKQD